MARRVVVTNGPEPFPKRELGPRGMENTKNGVNGIGPLTKAGAEGLPVHFAGELKNLDALDYLKRKRHAASMSMRSLA